MAVIYGRRRWRIADNRGVLGLQRASVHLSLGGRRGGFASGLASGLDDDDVHDFGPFRLQHQLVQVPSVVRRCMWVRVVVSE